MENPPQTLTPSCSPTVTGLDVDLRTRPVSYVLLLQAEDVNEDSVVNRNQAPTHSHSLAV